MFVAKQKRKENIAEYVLYMYQIEDLIRAFKLDLDLIEQKLVVSYKADETSKQEIKDWYANLVAMMKKEGKQQKGHLQFLSNLVKELDEFHLKLMQTGQDESYVSKFKTVAGLVGELRLKNTTAVNDVQVAIDGIYGYLMLKIQNKPISEETKEAVKRLSQWLAHLSKLYKDFEKGDLEF
ncbi:MAG TPA: DUF4924 family protein [Prolixibacteraceae bacterium]|nr:DUF4924 family protein [Prolixibacteraceae bacterium]